MFNPRQQWIPVCDPERLSRVVAQVVEREFGGSQRRAAFHLCGLPWPAEGLSVDDRRAVEATRVQVGRLIGLKGRGGEGDKPTLSLCHAQLVARLLGEQRRDDFLEIFLPDAVSRSVVRYQEWLDGKSVAPIVRVPMGPATGMMSDLATWVLRRHAIAYLRERFPRLLERLDRVLVDGGHSQERGELAMDRLVEPLFDHIRSGGVERGLEEMGHAELKRYVRLTIDREALLLKRAPDLERSHHTEASVELYEDALLNAAMAVADPRAFMPGKEGMGSD